MPTWLLLIVLSVATARLTRFVVKDDMPLIYYPREWVIRRKPDHRMQPAGKPAYDNHWWLGELLTCPWCTSAYIAAALVWAADVFGSVPLPVIVWAAVWGAGAWLTSKVV